MRTWTLVVSLLASLGLIAGCAGVDGDSTGDPGPRTSGLALSSDTLANTDVTGMKFKVKGCSGTPTSGVSQTVKKDLEDMYLPGGISEFEDKPYDADSKHLFSDHYFTLPAGCYDVTTQPLTGGGDQGAYSKSQDCKKATKNGVTVEDGQTNEILLINQCEGPKKGGLDVLGTINHPPEILSVNFKDSKFISSCSGTNKVCVNVKDPDNDPLEFVWSSTSMGQYQGTLTQVSKTKTGPNKWKVCAKITTGPKGDYGFQLKAYDQATDSTGQLNRIENILANQGNPNASNDKINFPVYGGVDCPGRSSVILMAMNNTPGPKSTGDAPDYIKQTAGWVNPFFADPGNAQVLYVMDDNDQGEHPGDDTYVTNQLIAKYGNAQVTKIDEPTGGLSYNSSNGSAGPLSQYDIVWFSNPGYPVDDPASHGALMEFRNTGGGLVIQGDDMAGPVAGGGPGNPHMDAFSFLNFQNNGVTTCGVTTNNNAGKNYSVSKADTHPVTDGLFTSSFDYGNDIDHTTVMGKGETVVLDAKVPASVCPSGSASATFPVSTIIDPADVAATDLCNGPCNPPQVP
jgi:hypothetical protein